jgi:hypothetical protein
VGFWPAFLLLLIWVPLVLVWLGALFDVARREDPARSRFAWIAVVLLLPLLGTFLYLVVHRPRARRRRAVLDASRPFVDRSVATSTGEQLALLGELHDRGVLSDEEFARERQRVRDERRLGA